MSLQIKTPALSRRTRLRREACAEDITENELAFIEACWIVRYEAGTYAFLARVRTCGLLQLVSYMFQGTQKIEKLVVAPGSPTKRTNVVSDDVSNHSMSDE